jgi:hypothetical protein
MVLTQVYPLAVQSSQNLSFVLLIIPIFKSELFSLHKYIWVARTIPFQRI